MRRGLEERGGRVGGQGGICASTMMGVLVGARRHAGAAFALGLDCGSRQRSGWKGNLRSGRANASKTEERKGGGEAHIKLVKDGILVVVVGQARAELVMHAESVQRLRLAAHIPHVDIQEIARDDGVPVGAELGRRD